MALYNTSVFVVRFNDGDLSLVRKIPTFVNSVKDYIHTVVDNEDLLDIAFQYYGKENLWYIIGFRNNIINPYELVVGSNLIIPYYHES